MNFPNMGREGKLREGERAEANSEEDEGGELSRTDEKHQFTRTQKANHIPRKVYTKTADSSLRNHSQQGK